MTSVGTWKRIVSYYGEPICNAVYRIRDTVFTCYKGPNIDFVEEWLHKHHLLHLWDAFYAAGIIGLDKLRECVKAQFKSVARFLSL